MYKKLHSYIDDFNKNDNELYVQLISNNEAEQFLAEQIPLINCPACFHIREGRWLKDSKEWIKEYINFWLDGIGRTDFTARGMPMRCSNIAQ